MNTEDSLRQPQQAVPPYYQYPPNHPYQSGDELSLIELWRVLARYKWLIILITTLSTLGAAYYASTLPTVYKAEVLMVSAGGGGGGGGGMSARLSGVASMVGINLQGGGGGVEQQALAKMSTRSFLVKYVEEKNLKPILFAERWDQQSRDWLDGEPSDSEVYSRFNSMLTTSTDKSGLTRVGIEWKNPVSYQEIANIANELVVGINEHAKNESITEAKKSIAFLEAELERTSLVNAQSVLYSLIESQMKLIMMANVRDEYVFKVIDPAVVPDKAETRPVLMIIGLGVVVGLFIGSFLAVSVNYFRDHT